MTNPRNKPQDLPELISRHYVTHAVLKSVLIYAVFSTLWIVLSDRVLAYLYRNSGAWVEFSIYKGMLFVLVTSVLLFLLMHHYMKELADKKARLRAHAERLALVGYALDHVHEAVFLVDEEARLINVNDESCRVLGYPREELVGKTVFDVDADFFPADWPGHWRELKEKQTLTFESRYRTRDGRAFPVEITANYFEYLGRAYNMALARDISERKRTEQIIRESEQRYRVLFAANPAPMWVYDQQSLKFLAVNDAAVSRYGYSREEFLAMTIADIRPEEDVPALHEAARRDLAAPQDYVRAGVWRHRRKDGSLLWAEISSHAMDFEGCPAHVVLAYDITERVEAQHQLRLTAQMFEASSEGIIITDAANRILTVNRAFSEITGYPAHEVIGRNPGMLGSGHHDAAFYQDMWHQLQTRGQWKGEIWNRRKNGEIFPEWLSISTIKDGGRVTHYVAMLTDATDYKAAEEKIHFLANYDSLTRLPNRSLLQERAVAVLDAARQASESVALMFIDLDRFKNVNDSLGLPVGDQILATLAQRLKRQLRHNDILCRPGGDEFMLLLPGADAGLAEHLARAVLRAIAEPITVAEHELKLTASIGIAQFPHDGGDLDRLSQCADAALFHAKHDGRNGFRFFTRAMHDRVSEELRVESHLRRALENGELLLHYQPQINIHSGALVGVEALVRWQHPEWGMVMPDRFIPVAEATGLIHDIGGWVLDEALRQLAEWRAQGLAVVPVAVNLSLAQFRAPDLCRKVSDALKRHGVAAALLELELTESIAMEDSAFTIDMLEQLHALGVALAIDDFGTGYSSLSYLKRFNVDKLKIDKSFVRDVTRDADDEAIVNAVIGLARGLGFRTIAEGVESVPQLDFLREHGCDEAQGYLFSRPLPAAEFARQLRRAAALSV